MPRANDETAIPATTYVVQRAPTSVSEAIAAAEIGLDEAVAPIPPRYWWASRLAIAVVPIVLALVCIRFGWAWMAERNLQAEIAKYVAAGEPIHPKDFDSPPVADADNAAKLYLDAATDLSFQGGDDALLVNLNETLENMAGRGEAIEALLAENAGVFEKLREARTRTGVDWKRCYRTPMINTVLPHLSGQRSLSKLLALAAAQAELTGDVDASIGYIRDAIALASATDVRPCLIDHLVSIAQYALAAHRIQALIPSLQICNDDSGDPGRPGCVPRDVIEELRDVVRATEEMHRRQRYAMYTERAIALDSLLAISRGDMRALASAGLTAATAVPRAVTFTLKPALLADTLFAVKHHDRMAQALKAETWPGALTRMPRAPRPVDIVDEWTHMLSTVFIASFDRAIVLHYRTVAIRRMAGLALAIRLYELDHGERPTELSALLPDYIDALPIDPFGDGERTFGYLPDALWPRIYTVGPNGTDDAGEIGFHPSGGVHWDHLDPPFFLDGAGPQTEEELSKTRELRQRAADDDR